MSCPTWWSNHSEALTGKGGRSCPSIALGLRLMLKEKPSGIAGSCTYKVDLFEANTFQDWIAEYEAILAKAVANPERSLGLLTDH